ncbi:MAG: bifunctional 4-hydroxy-2-oxoglutarate aldolase/2-dehydro-3-deoxy-phosphogluconate aldolase [Angelakisella sp.]|nr:bifunctional 4-hydroxy-2-oxoglutarate aldolase/2-dehydro-3-deoxy-phosphogluconate aldolase [Angelakisella sp.]
MNFSIQEALARHKIVVGIRGVDETKLLSTIQALYDGGIRLVEITYDQSSSARLRDTTKAIDTICQRFGDDLAVGAGTVLTSQEVEQAKAAGAKYILSPNCDKAVIHKTKELEMGSVPGAMTPSEVVNAYNFGGDVIKLFPCDCLGLNYIKALKAPISHVPLLAMGGVNAQNLRDYLKLVEGVGVASAIVDKSMIAQGNFEGITNLTQQFVRQL